MPIGYLCVDFDGIVFLVDGLVDRDDGSVEGGIAQSVDTEYYLESFLHQREVFLVNGHLDERTALVDDVTHGLSSIEVCAGVDADVGGIA